MSFKPPESQGNLPHPNYSQNSSTSTASTAFTDEIYANENNKNNKKIAKKTPSFVKRIRTCLSRHCNRSRIILVIIGLLTISAIITVILILNKNPFALIRPLCKSQFGSSSFNQTLIFLSKLEYNQISDDSSIPYNEVDSMGYSGKYKFGEVMLSNLGYYKTNISLPQNETNIKNYWNGTWTGKNGCNSYYDFLNNKFNVQEIAIREAFQFNLVKFNQTLTSYSSYNLSLYSFLDKPFKFSSGCNFQSDGLSVSNITLAGILISSYLILPENVGQALVSGIAPCDNKTSATPTSLTRYLLDFGGCDFSLNDVNEAVSSFNASFNASFNN
ncbi:LysM peptidoglycan-binding domain-containing protein [Gigaspora margarita]|uniref:LysM peptidoglycan-binding domain-containing protein n=1 Tax=Gigaspora margarita TaxID=4874 RepID=A0A8H3XJ18_GIGMA|nr:LysM peptidoglycan-binding domain-containing protein [Gigaspora margarita]